MPTMEEPASRQADLFQSKAGTNIPDLPPEFNEFFGGDDQHGRSSTRSTAQGIRVEPGDSSLRPHVATQHRRSRRRSEDDRSSSAGSASTRAATSSRVRTRLPVKIICDMMGIPRESARVRLRHDEHHPQNPTRAIPNSCRRRQNGVRSKRSLAPAPRWPDSSMTLRGQADGSDGDTLTHALVNAEIDGDKLTRTPSRAWISSCSAFSGQRNDPQLDQLGPHLPHRHNRRAEGRCSRAISTPTCPAPWRKSSGTQAR